MLVGNLRDRFGSYDTGFLVLVGAALVGAAAIALLPQRKQLAPQPLAPMRITDAQSHHLQSRTELRHAQARDRRRRVRSWRCDAERPRACGGELLERPRDSAPHQSRRATDRGHVAIPLQGRVLAAWPGHDVGDQRGGYGALGHPGQDGQRARVSPARRRVTRRRDGVRPRQRIDARRDGARGAGVHRDGLSRRPRAVRHPRRRQCLRCRSRHAVLRAGAERHAARERVEHRTVPGLRAAAVRAPSPRGRLRRAPAARRASPPDADRGGAARQEPRAVPAVLAGGSGAGGEPGRASGRSATTRRRRSPSARSSTPSTTVSSSSKRS